jgi:hypothetical protein
MDIGLFILSFAIFIYISILIREIWFAPKKYAKRMDAYRNFMNWLPGFSYRANGFVDWPFVKLMSIFMLILAVLGIIISFTGPLPW